MSNGGLSCCDVEGIVWEYIDQPESEFFYHEIFIGESYMRGGITLNDGDTIVDAGANIGLFSLFCLSRAHNIRLYAIEPIPPIFDVLRRNLRSYMRTNEIILLQCGLGSDCQENVEFHYLMSSPGESTRHIEERKSQQSLLRLAMRMHDDHEELCPLHPENYDSDRIVDGGLHEGQCLERSCRREGKGGTEDEANEDREEVQPIPCFCPVRTLADIMCEYGTSSSTHSDEKAPDEWVVDLLKVWTLHRHDLPPPLPRQCNPAGLTPSVCVCTGGCGGRRAGCAAGDRQVDTASPLF